MKDGNHLQKVIFSLCRSFSPPQLERQSPAAHGRRFIRQTGHRRQVRPRRWPRPEPAAQGGGIAVPRRPSGPFPEPVHDGNRGGVGEAGVRLGGGLEDDDRRRGGDVEGWGLRAGRKARPHTPGRRPSSRLTAVNPVWGAFWYVCVSILLWGLARLTPVTSRYTIPHTHS